MFFDTMTCLLSAGVGTLVLMMFALVSINTHLTGIEKAITKYLEDWTKSRYGDKK